MTHDSLLPRSWRLAVAALMLLALSMPARAARPIELVVPYPAGGYADAVGRYVAEALSKQLSETVIVLNKPGAASLVGTRYVIEQPRPDGRTILLVSLGYLTLQLRDQGAHFDAHSLAPLIQLGNSPAILYVRSGIPARNVGEFVAWSKRASSGVLFGTSGVGSSPHLYAEDFASIHGLATTAVPFQGSAASMVALAGGHIDAVFGSTEARDLADAGKIRPLFVSSGLPLSTWPEVPTAIAAGLNSFRAGTWFGLLVSARTPLGVQDKLNKEINASLTAEAATEHFKRMDFIPIGGSPEAFGQFLAAEKGRLRTLIQQRNIRLD